MNWQSSVVDPVLHVVVVGFHHKKGCQVEYAYPPLIEGNDVASHECPKKWKHLPSLALPDGAHNFSEDTIYFHLPSLDDSQTTIFGVSCCQQIDASEVLNKSTDVTRNTVQKSVCVLSRLPVFGLIQVKLEMITQAYFKGRDFTQVELLEDTYKTLNSSLTECLLQNSHIHLGLSGRDLLKQFRHKLVILFKLFLLEKRVLFYSSPVKPICTSILAVASLFPGLIEQGLFESARFNATETSPTTELNPPFQKSSEQPKGDSNLGDNQSSKMGNLDIPQNNSTTSHSNRNASNLTSSLGQLPQQKWHAVTFSQLRSKFFSSFKVSNESSTVHPLLTSSLPSIPLSTSPEVMGASMFYNDVSSPGGTDKTSEETSKNNSADSYTNVANSTFFITPQTTTTEPEQNETIAASDPNQAPIHFSRQSSLAEKQHSRSVTVDKKIPEECSGVSLSSSFQHSDVKQPVSSARDFYGDSTGQASAINAEDMLVDDDDDDIFKEGSHRLEINEYNIEVTAEEMEPEMRTPDQSNEVFQPDRDQSDNPKFTPDTTSPSSFIVGSDNFGLPLMIFSKGTLCHPYLSLHLYDLLTDPGVSGFTIGATNALFRQRKQLLDVIVELSESKIDIIDVELRKQLTLSTADLRFADTLVRGLAEESGDPFLDNTGWEGGDDWIRSQFRSYLMSLLATVHHGDDKAEEDFNSLFIEAWKSTHNYKTWMEGGPYKAVSAIPPQHLCKGNLTMSDFKLRINQVINNGTKERRITSVVNQTVTQTGKAVGAAVNLAKSTVSNWFGGFSSKE